MNARRVTHVCAFDFPPMRHELQALGAFYSPAPLPEDIDRLPAGLCRENAALLVAFRPDLQNVSGFAVAKDSPRRHAWTIDTDGRVIDPTWASIPIGVGSAYFGVVGPSSLVGAINRRVARGRVCRSWTVGVTPRCEAERRG
jgi:hypothetical protein